jgi:uncharacterized protein (TIGR03435 family)
MKPVVPMLTFAMAVASETLAQKPAFEVASIKQNNSGAPLRFSNSPGRFSATNETVRQLIQGAYHFQDFQVLGGPDWIGSVRFDIEAKYDPSPGNASQVDMRVRALLEDRFQLKAHQETRDLQVYELSLAQRGAGKLIRSDEKPSATTK